MPALTLTVNGVEHQLDVPAGRFLAEVLRYDLGPVSYTHLDVYKRQPGACGGFVGQRHACR